MRRRKAQQSLPQQRQFGDRSAALSAGIVLALVLTIAIIGLGAFMMLGRQSVQQPPPADIVIDGDSVRVGPNAGIPFHAPDKVIIAPAAPIAPNAPAADVTTNEDRKEALREAQEAVRQARTIYDYQSKSIDSADVKEAQRRLEQAEGNLRKIEDEIAASTIAR